MSSPTARPTAPRTLGVALVVAVALVATSCAAGPQDADARPSVSATPTAAGPPSAATAEATASPAATPDRLRRVRASFEQTPRTFVLRSKALRVVFDRDWGGAIREIWRGRRQVVNNYDGGRLLAVSLYDGATTEGSEPGDTGWNPTPSDIHDHVNRPVRARFSNGRLHLAARYVQWYPDNKGGGVDDPVPTPVVVDTWAEFVGDPAVLHLTYRVTHRSRESHQWAGQEFPFVYVREPFGRLVTYAGEQPWTGGDVDLVETVPDHPAVGSTRATERWAAMVDERGFGLSLFAPQAYDSFVFKHFTNGPDPEDSCSYLLPQTFLEIGPRQRLETEAFVHVGRWSVAREQFAEINALGDFPDTQPPVGYADGVPAGTSVSGVVDLAGWAFDDRGPVRARVYVDGAEATVDGDFGLDRPDVAADYPDIDAATRSGYVVRLDTTDYPNGEHVVRVVTVDGAGNASTAAPGRMRLRFDN